MTRRTAVIASLAVVAAVMGLLGTVLHAMGGMALALMVTLPVTAAVVPLVLIIAIQPKRTRTGSGGND